MTNNNKGPILQMKGICKSYGGVKALQNVDFELYHGEILALVGDNGAGKSTLIKIIAGVHKYDEGKILIEGREVKINSPSDAAQRGIATVYQELALVEELNISQNLFLGRELVIDIKPLLLKILKIKKMEKESSLILNSIGFSFPNLNEKAKNLSGGQRQAVAIGRASYWGSKILLMDEPTASLGVAESKKVLDTIIKLKEKGLSIIIVSHNLQHVFSVADRVMVLRRGRRVGDRIKNDTDTDEIVKMITGAEFGNSYLS